MKNSVFAGIRRRSTAVGAAIVTMAAVCVAITGTAAPASAWPSSTVTITGHGYGHGQGMGQYGAYGYAVDYGWSYTQIVGHYYGGTHLANGGNPGIRVDLSELAGSALTVTSSVAFTAGGIAVPAGHAARMSLSGSHWVVATSASCTSAFGAAKVASSAVMVPKVAPTTPSTMLTVCSTGRAYRGDLGLANSGGLHTINLIPLESYLRGVVPRESPASWGDADGGKGMAALQAQAVAARSYTMADHRTSYANICDSQDCQVYGGAGLHGVSQEDSRTDRAISSTAGKFLANSAGAPVAAEYSSSTGGWTAGGSFPAVQDLGDVESPNHNWSTSLSAAGIAADYGVGRLTGLVVTQRNGLGADGGRVLALKIQGTTRTVTVTGNSFQGEYGLKSNWFSIGRAAVSPYLEISNSPSAAYVSAKQLFGWNGDIPLTCDWNGDHADTGAVFRQGVWYLRNSFVGGSALTTIGYGAATDLPVCGDWNHDGIDTIGVYRSSNETFYLRNSNTPGNPQIAIKLGIPGDLPVAGDWNGDGTDTVGVFRPSTSTYYLLNTNAGTAPRITDQYGGAWDLPVVGDFNGDHKDTIGVFRDGIFNLTNKIGGTTNLRYKLGGPGDLPLMGDWNHDGVDTPGIAHLYTQY